MKTIRGTLGGVPKSNFFSFQDIIMSVTGILIIIALMLALQIDRVTESPDQPRLSSDSDPPALNQHHLNLQEEVLFDKQERLKVLQSASRKSESVAEISMEISRLEDQIAGITAHSRPEGGSSFDSTSIHDIKTKAVEIIRLREEIKEYKDALSLTTDSTGEASLKMQILERDVRQVEALVAEARLQNNKLSLIRKLSDTSKEPVIVDVGGNRLKIIRFDMPQPVEMSSVREFNTQLKNYRRQDQYFILYFRPSGAARFEELKQSVKNSGFEIGYDAIEENAELSLGKSES